MKVRVASGMREGKCGTVMGKGCLVVGPLHSFNVVVTKEFLNFLIFN